MKRTGWSYSSLSSYELCPKKYYHERIAQDTPRIESEAATRGSEIHSHIERFLLGAIPELLPHEVMGERNAVAVAQMKKIASVRGRTLLVEHKMALTADLMPCDFDAPDYWVRGIIDVAILQDGKRAALIADWKTGRAHHNTDQLILMALMLLAHIPELVSVRAFYYWLKHSDMSSVIEITRTNAFLKGWSDFMLRSERMLTDEEFKPRPNYLCARWCPVKECPHNGG